MELQLTQLPKKIQQRRPELLPKIVDLVKEKDIITVYDVITTYNTSYKTARILLNYLTEIGILDMIMIGNTKIYKLKKKQ